MYIFLPHFRYVFVLPLLLCAFLFSLLLHTLLFSSLPPGFLVCPWPCSLHAYYASSLITQYPWWIGFWADNLFFCFMRSYQHFFFFRSRTLNGHEIPGKWPGYGLEFQSYIMFHLLLFSFRLREISSCFTGFLFFFFFCHFFSYSVLFIYKYSFSVYPLLPLFLFSALCTNIVPSPSFGSQITPVDHPASIRIEIRICWWSCGSLIKQQTTPNTCRIHFSDLKFSPRERMACWFFTFSEQRDYWRAIPVAREPGNPC